MPVARILHALPLFDVTLNERLAYAAAAAIALLVAIAADAWPAAARLRAIGVAACILAAALPAVVMRRLVVAEILPLAVVAVLLAVRTPMRIALPLICGLVLMQRAAVDGGIYPVLPRSAFYPRVPALDSIPKNAPEPFRVAGVGFTLLPNGATMYGLEDARGYDAMTLERLVETYPLWSTPQAASFNVVEDPKRPFLSFLNVRYFITDRGVLANPGALPRAFVPRQIRFDRSALPSMLESSDFAGTAWIEVPEQPPATFDNARGTVKTTRAPNGLDLAVHMDGDGWVVASEAAWKGWRSSIDGRRVRWRFANHAFIGIYVPAGDHRVSLRYQPDAFARGRAISLIALLGIVIGLVTARRSSSAPSARVLRGA